MFTVVSVFKEEDNMHNPLLFGKKEQENNLSASSNGLEKYLSAYFQYL